MDDLDRVADGRCVGTVGPFFNVLPLKQAELIVTIGSELRWQSGDQQESIGSGVDLGFFSTEKKMLSMVTITDQFRYV